MQSVFTSNFKIGILGGGQLGKMLVQAAQNWHLKTWVLDASKNFPAGGLCTSFQEGDFKNFDDVYHFGKQVDVLTIEIEHVNVEALLRLEKEGLKIHPNPDVLTCIKDKGLQKQFYEKKHLPTASFSLYKNGEAVLKSLGKGELQFPFVQKSRTAGYDGRGVAVLRSEADLGKLLPVASVVEPVIDIEKELAVMVARNEKGEVKAFPVVEMRVNPIANLVEYLICPAALDPAFARRAEELAKTTIKAFNLCGLLAVELFLTKDNQLLINEVAPRPHNSGHHTIDSCYTTQFEQHLRSILNLPLGSTKMKTSSVMVNLLGEAGCVGEANYEGLEACLSIEGVKLHLYGKKNTKPFRKMGHATILDADLEKAMEKARFVKNTLKIKNC